MPQKVFAFPEQSQILSTVFARDNSLQELITEMRNEYRRQLDACATDEEREEKRNQLSCVIWFAGAASEKTESCLKIDHKYFLRSDDIGIGLSIHPEDSLKARVPFFHPHQIEIFQPVEGEIELEYVNQGRLALDRLRAGDVRVVQNGICHRVKYRPPDAEPAAYVFVKTNLGARPGKLPANQCPLGNTCPVHASYENEAKHFFDRCDMSTDRLPTECQCIVNL